MVITIASALKMINGNIVRDFKLLKKGARVTHEGKAPLLTDIY